MQTSPDSPASIPDSADPPVKSSSGAGKLIGIGLAFLFALGSVSFVAYQVMNWKPDDTGTKSTEEAAPGEPPAKGGMGGPQMGGMKGGPGGPGGMKGGPGGPPGGGKGKGKGNPI